MNPLRVLQRARCILDNTKTDTLDRGLVCHSCHEDPHNETCIVNDIDKVIESLTRITKRTEYVNCPVCGESDMPCEYFEEDDKLIHCTNHACASNGGENFSALVANGTIETSLRRRLCDEIASNVNEICRIAKVVHDKVKGARTPE